MPLKNIEEVYCLVDSLVKQIDEILEKKASVGRKSLLSKTDYIVLSLVKQRLSFNTTKQLYDFTKSYLVADFGPVPSYQQFNKGIKSVFRYMLVIVDVIMKLNRKKDSRYLVVDSTPIPVCQNSRRYSANVFRGIVSSGKNMNGWFHGFKLHLIVNHNMEIVSMKITKGSTSDIRALDNSMVKGLVGWLVGDRGYISKDKTKELAQKGLKLVTKQRKNMRQLPSTSWLNYIIGQRQKIESVFASLKYRLSAINKYARSPEGFFVQLFSAIITFSLPAILKNLLNGSHYSNLLIS